MSETKTTTIINHSKRSIVTSKGELSPGTSQELPSEEAKKLLDYDGVVDAATYVPGGKGGAQVAELKAKVADLEKKLSESDKSGAVKKLQDEKEELAQKVAELEAKIAANPDELAKDYDDLVAAITKIDESAKKDDIVAAVAALKKKAGV